jgi:hypothetical protein
MTYGVDALRCPMCADRMRVMTTLTEPFVVKKILAGPGLATEPLPRARARDATGQESFDFDVACVSRRGAPSSKFLMRKIFDT